MMPCLCKKSRMGRWVGLEVVHEPVSNCMRVGECEFLT